MERLIADASWFCVDKGNKGRELGNPQCSDEDDSLQQKLLHSLETMCCNVVLRSVFECIGIRRLTNTDSNNQNNVEYLIQSLPG